MPIRAGPPGFPPAGECVPEEEESLLQWLVVVPGRHHDSSLSAPGDVDAVEGVVDTLAVRTPGADPVEAPVDAVVRELLDQLGAQLRRVTRDKQGEAVTRLINRRRPGRISGEAAPVTERRQRCHIEFPLAVLVYAST